MSENGTEGRTLLALRPSLLVFRRRGLRAVSVHDDLDCRGNRRRGVWNRLRMVVLPRTTGRSVGTTISPSSEPSITSATADSTHQAGPCVAWLWSWVDIFSTDLTSTLFVPIAHLGISTQLVTVVRVSEEYALRKGEVRARERRVALVATAPAVELPIILWNYQENLSDLLACELRDILRGSEQRRKVHAGVLHDFAYVGLLDGKDAVESDVRLDDGHGITKATCQHCGVVAGTYHAWRGQWRHLVSVRLIRDMECGLSLIHI